MKKIFILTIICVLILSFCSCGNMGVGPGNYNFEHVHISTFGGENNCYNLKKWYDNESGIEVQTTDGTSFYFSEGTYILVENENKCPFCN